VAVQDRALAGALDNSAVGIKGIAMGSALTGIADDASAVYFNPAGLAFLASGDTHFEAYGYFSFTSFAYENAGAAFESIETGRSRRPSRDERKRAGSRGSQTRRGRLSVK